MARSSNHFRHVALLFGTLVLALGSGAPGAAAAGGPDTAFSSTPPTVTGATSATFTFTGEDEQGNPLTTFECRVDHGPWDPCTSPKDYWGVTEGAHTVEVRAIDAGTPDATPATYVWVVDTGLPSTVLLTAPPSPSASSSATFTFTGNDPGGTGVQRYECKLDLGPWDACSSGGETLSGLTDGVHNFAVRAIDGVGNMDHLGVSHTWTVDTAAPTTTMSLQPAGATAATSASFAFTGADFGAGVTGFECQLDAGAWEVCTSPQTLTGLADGTRTFRVRALDGAGNSDPTPATSTWTVDTTAPSTVISTRPDAVSTQTTATFAFGGGDPGGSGVASYECKLGNGAWGACVSPASYPGLADGAHDFAVRAVDAAGNVDPTPSSYAWTLDATGPAPSPPAPQGPSAVARPTLTFTSEPGATLEIRVDGSVLGLVPVGPSGTASWTPPVDLDDGARAIIVVGIDALGNRGPASTAVALRIAARPPAAPRFEGAPAASSRDRSPSFTIAGSGNPDATFQCRVDGGAWAPCERTVSLSGLGDGVHSLAAREVTEAGVLGADRELTWTVDTAAPAAPVFVKAPPASTEARTARIEVRAEAGAEIRCWTDESVAVDCSRGLDLNDLARGKHIVRAVAFDAAGNESPSASHAWTIEGPVAAAVARLTGRVAAKTAIRASRPVASVTCQLSEGATVRTCKATAYARVGKKLVVVATGKRAVSTAGTRIVGLKLKLNTRGKAALRKSPRGLKVSVKLAARTREGATLTARVKTKLYRKR